MVVIYDDERLQFPSLPVNWHRKPYLYLYLVNCEDGDSYKQLVKGKIRAWVQTMGERGQEWLIVYFSRERRGLSEISSKLHRTVYDKIRADFNNKKDRCVTPLHSHLTCNNVGVVVYTRERMRNFGKTPSIK